MSLAFGISILVFCATARAQVDGSWVTNGNGNWSDGVNWSTNPTIPGGAGSEVDFTIFISGNTTIDLQSTSRTVGILNVGTTSGNFDYLFTAGSGTSLIFDNGANPAELNAIATADQNNFTGVNIQLDTSLNISNASDKNQTLGTISAGTGVTTRTLATTGAGTGRILVNQLSDGATGTLALHQNSATSDFVLLTANTYSGGTTVDSGRVFVGNATSFGSGVVTLNGGTVNNSGSGNFNIANTFEINGNVGFLDSASGSGDFLLSGAATITDNVVIDVGKEVMTVANTWSDGGNGYSLTKTGAGQFFLSTNGLATYTGGTIIQGGEFRVAGLGNHLADAAPVTVEGGAFDVFVDETIGTLTLRSGSIGGTTGSIIASSYAVESGTATQVLAGGSSALTKTTAGSVTLSAANTYGGGTTISAGSLILSGAGTIGSGDVSIADAATLDISAITASSYTLSASQTLSGSGTVTATGKTLVVNGTLAPGNSPGLLTIDGAFTLGSTSTTQFELDGLTRGVSYDALDVSGLFTLDGTVNVTGTHTFAAGNSFDLINWGSLDSTGFNVGTDLLLPTLAGPLSWDTSSFLSTGAITVIPEPGTFALVAGTFLGLSVLRNRRRSSS